MSDENNERVPRDSFVRLRKAIVKKQQCQLLLFSYLRAELQELRYTEDTLLTSIANIEARLDAQQDSNRDNAPQDDGTIHLASEDEQRASPNSSMPPLRCFLCALGSKEDNERCPVCIAKRAHHQSLSDAAVGPDDSNGNDTT